MQIIEIKNSDKEKWNDFVLANKGEFLQSWEWGSFQWATGKIIWRLVVAGENDEFLAVALIIKHRLPLGKNYLYCPRGLVFKNAERQTLNAELMKKIIDKVKEVAKKENSVYLKWESAYPLQLPLEGGGNNLLGNRVSKSANLQPHDSLILDLDKTEEELLAQMKQKTRYNIRLAEKHGVEVRISDEKTFEFDFEKFWALTEETTARDKFQSHSKEYYRQMLEFLGGEISSKVLVASPYTNLNNKQFKKNNTAISSFSSDNFNKGRIGMGVKLFLAEFKGKIIAANIVIFFGNRATYLHGASGAEHRNLMTPYLLQWKQIKKAREKGFKEYDFWGIIGNEKLKIKNEKFRSENLKINDWQGITRFKIGFGGREINYPEAIDIVYQPIVYKAIKIAKKLKAILKS